VGIRVEAMPLMLDPRAIAAALATRAAVTAVIVGARRLEVAVLDERERRALRKVVRDSIMEAALAHQAVAQISADIDLAGREDVIDELLAASVPHRRAQWTAARSAWAELYGGQAPDPVIDMLADAAADLRARLQRSSVLRPLWSALAIEQLSEQVYTLEERLGHVIDPAAAIRFRGPDIAKNPTTAVAVASALAEQLAREEPGKLLGIEAVGADGSVRIHPLPGVDLQVTVTKTVPNTIEGRAELDRLNKAMASGEPIDMGEVSIETRLGGQAVQLFPETGHLTAGPATREVHVVLSVSSAPSGIEERIVLTCDATRTGEAIDLVARSGNRGLLRADIRLEVPTRRATFRFRLADEGTLRLADQVLLHRVLAAFAAGGTVEMYLVEFNLNSRSEFGPQPEFDDSPAVLSGLELLVEVSTLLHVESEPLESFNDKDVALLAWARQLLTTEEAPMSAGEGSLTLRGTKGMWATLAAKANPEGRIDFSIREDAMPLELSGRVIDLGPVIHRFQGARLPAAPRREGRVTAVDITWDETATHTVRRIPPGEEPE
jgi:hypothetical protein